MTDAISREEYEDEVDEYAAWLTEEAIEAANGEHYEEASQAATELASDILNGHNWFARNYHGASLYGSIIEHSEQDPEAYHDWRALSEADSPAGTVKKLAYIVFQTDVMVEALDRLEDE